METRDIMDKLLRSYETYYDVRAQKIEPPFVAEAEFHSHEEHFFLSRRAVIDEVENNEIVYFATADSLSIDAFLQLDEKAWERGIAKARPSEHHQSSDVSLIIIAGNIEKDAIVAIKKAKHSLSYKHCLHGYSNYHLIAADLSTGRIVYNRLGYTMKKLLKSVLRS